MKNQLKRALKVLIVGSVLIGCGAIIGAIAFSSSTVKAITQTVEVDTTSSKIADLKQDLVARLSQCESGGKSESDGIIIFDTNAKASIGVLQFQIKTVQTSYKAIYGSDLSGKEAIELALDKDQAFKLATAIIFGNVQGGITNWANCANKLNLAQEVKILNKLSK